MLEVNQRVHRHGLSNRAETRCLPGPGVAEENFKPANSSPNFACPFKNHAHHSTSSSISPKASSLSKSPSSSPVASHKSSSSAPSPSPTSKSSSSHASSPSKSTEAPKSFDESPKSSNAPAASPTSSSSSESPSSEGPAAESLELASPPSPTGDAPVFQFWVKLSIVTQYFEADKYHSGFTYVGKIISSVFAASGKDHIFCVCCICKRLLVLDYASFKFKIISSVFAASTKGHWC
ncbi:hypothetical protein CRYUN_Cryun10bG0101700 [Craigia yunnanensis]